MMGNQGKYGLGTYIVRVLPAMVTYDNILISKDGVGGFYEKSSLLLSFIFEGDPQSMIRNSLYYKELREMGHQWPVSKFSVRNS
jgi:hypothetical protein